jgi:septal ring factor EnvC (AmiA/AmiB activator)
MKANIVVLVFVIVIMLASLGGTYFLFTQQDQMNGKKLEAVKADVEKLSATLRETSTQFKDLDSQVKAAAFGFRGLEEKISLGDTQSKDIAAKVDSLMMAVEELKGGAKIVPAALEIPAVVAAPAPETPAVTEPTPTPVSENPPVDLGQIPVEK